MAGGGLWGCGCRDRTDTERENGVMEGDEILLVFSKT